MRKNMAAVMAWRIKRALPNLQAGGFFIRVVKIKIIDVTEFIDFLLHFLINKTQSLPLMHLNLIDNFVCFSDHVIRFLRRNLLAYLHFSNEMDKGLKHGDGFCIVTVFIVAH